VTTIIGKTEKQRKINKIKSRLTRSIKLINFYLLREVTKINFLQKLKESKEYYEQLYINKLNNIDEMNKLKKHKLPNSQRKKSDT
jgi:hypothetical protein